MDARQRHTRVRLDEAILELAARTAVDRIAVADVARRAGIARDTFYRWSSSPAHLLADTLDRRLDIAIAERSAIAASDGRADLDVLTETILSFVAEHAAIYRMASTPRLDATLRDGLVTRIEGVLDAWLDAHPGIAPGPGGAAAGSFDRAVYVAYAASGVVGVYEVWLARGDLEDIAGIEALIYRAAASWWRGEGG